MRKLVLPLIVAMASMMAGSAFAQSSGEADPAQAKAPPAAPTTRSERAEARSGRQSAGAQAARGPQIGEGQVKPATGPRVSSTDRKAARSKRRAANREANQAGQLPRGGNNDAPERQKP